MLGERAGTLIEQAIEYAGIGDAGPLECGAVEYADAVSRPIRGRTRREELRANAAAEATSPDVGSST